ncbi:MAG: phage holin family protein [Thalassospira sp.]|uniref:phage holin family protein n=1 Tax=Thalassospira sp. TaxID=1912094 RepID=UPI003A8C4915
MDKPPHEIEPEWLTALKFWWPVAGLTIYARILWHRNLVAKGFRRFWGRELLWELGTAGFCFAISMGVVDYFDFSIEGACAVATLIGWLGPKGLQAMLLGRLKGV